MIARVVLHLACTLTLSAMLGACATPGGGYGSPGGGYGSPAPGGYPAPSPGAPLGTLVDIRGPNAFYQRGSSGPALRASQGQPVYEGDRIFTGQDTRMTLRFARGGHAELDEMTDPVPRFLSDLGCLIVDLLRTGRMFVDGSAVCVGAVGTIARQDSQVVYDVRPGYAQITVAGGRAQLRRPQTVDIPAGWRVDANARQVMQGGRAYQLTRSQVEDTVRWTRWYQQTRPALPGIADSAVIPRTTPVPRTTEPATPRPPAQTTAPPAQSTTPPAGSLPPTRVVPRLQRTPQSQPSDVIR